MLISYGKDHMDEPWQTQRLADLEAVSALYAGYAAQLAMGDKVVIPKYYHALPEYWFKISLEEGGVPAIGGDYSFYGAWLSTATEAACALFVLPPPPVLLQKAALCTFVAL